MAGNTFGTIFRSTTFGESHGKAIGVVIDGCPAGLTLDLSHIQLELNRRKPGQSKLVSPRKENDEFEIFSGVFEGKTTGCPIMVMVRNEDAKSKDYEKIKDLFRPGHADFTYFAKHGFRDHRGGGRSSARETIGRVIAGAVAKQLLSKVGISILGGVTKIGNVEAKKYVWDSVESNDVRSVDPEAVEAMISEIEKARKDRDSVGGILEVQAHGVPPGIGEPVFDRLEAVLSLALMSIPAVKGVEIGLGFKSASLRGSEMNDEMFPDGFASNNHGGVLGGLSSGAPIVARVALKPTSSIPQEKNTIDTSFSKQTISTLGRHDPCVVMRAVPIAEAMLALTLVDLWLIDLAKKSARSHFSDIEKVEYGLRSK